MAEIRLLLFPSFIEFIVSVRTPPPRSNSKVKIEFIVCVSVRIIFNCLFDNGFRDI